MILYRIIDYKVCALWFSVKSAQFAFYLALKGCVIYDIPGLPRIALP